MKESNSCDITNKNSCNCGEESDHSTINYQDHWNGAYRNSEMEQLGWYEKDVSPTLDLIARCNLEQDSRLLHIGAGVTTLIDELLARGYSNQMATDISSEALIQLENRLGSQLEYIVDDLTEPTTLKNIGEVDLWIDRAVLHFFTEKKDRETYANLISSTVRKGGYALLAQFHLEGAAKCSGLDVYRYDEKMLAELLGTDFELITHFTHTYTMPKGGLRPYVYTLFQRV
jgi:hypothetical protein